MGIFSRLWSVTPQDLCNNIAHNIALQGAFEAKHVKKNKVISECAVCAGAELIHALLYLLDITAFREAGPDKRNIIIDNVNCLPYTTYIKELHRFRIVERSTDLKCLDALPLQYNARAQVYGRCRNFIGEDKALPGPGSISYVLAYYSLSALEARPLLPHLEYQLVGEIEPSFEEWQEIGVVGFEPLKYARILSDAFKASNVLAVIKKMRDMNLDTLKSAA